jgi:hypothetical protein
VKTGGKWRNKKIANLCGHRTVNEALMLIPERVKELECDVVAFIESTEQEIQTGWHRRVIERHEEEIEKLEREHTALRQYCDGTENGTFEHGGGI